MSLHVAFCLWGLPEDPAAATAFAASAGFQSVDVRPGYGSLAASDRTLPVTCMAVAHLMPEGAMLDATSEPARQLAVDHVRAGILEAQSLGVPDVYLAPPATSDAPALAAYRETALTLADEALRSGVRLGIEHFPGRGLPTVRQTLDFISACGHDNLYMLLGHRPQPDRRGVRRGIHPGRRRPPPVRPPQRQRRPERPARGPARGRAR